MSEQTKTASERRPVASENSPPSARAAPKCKACKQPVKGHPGKTGIGKCTVVLAESDPPSPELRQREKKTVVEKRSVVTALADDLKAVAIDERGGQAVSISEQEAQVASDADEAAVDEEPVESSEEEILEESLIALPSVESAQKKRLEAARERVASYCHADFDTWPFLRERTFVICLCGTGDAEDFCDCPGELRFGKELEDEGMIILFPIFVDPLTQENWKVVLSFDSYQNEGLCFRLSLPGKRGVVLDGEARVEVRRLEEREGRRMKISIRPKMFFSDVRIAYTDGAYADAGIRRPQMVDQMSASLWQLMDEEPTDDCGQGDLVKEVVPAVSDSDDGESALERGAGTGEPGDEVTRVEESEEDDHDHPGQEEETAGERQGSEYDSEYEEDLSWEEGEESELSASRSLASSTLEEEEQSSDESDFVEV